MAKNILITGCAGFIGSCLAKNLLLDGFNVVGLDNYDSFYSRGIKELRINDLKGYSNFSFFEEDVLKIHEVLNPQDIDVCIHLAAKAGVLHSVKNPFSYFHNNVNSTTHLLNFLSLNKHIKFLMGSSSSIYDDGNHDMNLFKEDFTPIRPMSPYSHTKYICEQICDVWHHNSSMDILKLRFFSVYGCQMRPDLAIYKFSRQILEGKTITLFGDGRSRRDYTHIDDIVDGINLAVKYSLDNEAINESFNLGNANPVELSELIKLLSEIFQIPARVNHDNSFSEEMTFTGAHLEKSRKMLGYHPKYNLREGLLSMSEWLAQNPYGTTY